MAALKINQEWILRQDLEIMRELPFALL